MGIQGSTEIRYNIVQEKLYKFKPFVFEKVTPCDKTVPKPRSGHRIVCNNSDLFSYGGYNPAIDDADPEMKDDENWHESKPLFKEVWKFNFASRKWKRLKILNIPSVLASNAVFLSGSILMVYGGTGVPFGGHCSNALYICDLSKEDLHFRPVFANGSRPEPQYGQAIIVIDHFLYVIGGTTGYEYSSDVHRLDLKTGVWEQVYVCKGSFDEPEGRYRHELGFDGKKIYVLGGGTADLAFGFEELPVFDIELKKWMRVETLPDPKMGTSGHPLARRFHSCIQKPGTKVVIIIGGFNGVDILDDTWQLDLSSLQWLKLTDTKLPLPTHFHSSAVTPSGHLMSFGGINLRRKGTEMVDRSADIYSAWVCIPKLKEISWEAVKYYKLVSYVSEPLMKLLGYPSELDRSM